MSRFKAKEVMAKVAAAKEHWKEMYRLFEEDFTAVWETSVQKVYGSRFDPGRPQFHIQQARKYIRNLVGKARASKPGIKISARTDAPVDYLKDIVRFVESDSGASHAYMKALMHAATYGLGFIQICHSKEAGEVPLRIKAVEDIFTAYIDPESEEQDGSDAEYCFFEETETKTDADGKQEKESRIQFYETEGGECWWAQIENEKITGEGKFICPRLPLIPVYGQAAKLGSRRIVYGEARPLKGMQDYFDYLVSKNAEGMAINKPIMAVPKNAIDKKQFAQVARDPIPIVEYLTVAENGETPLGKPEILRLDSNTESVMAGANLVKGAMADITGIYDASLGYSKTDAESGAAIIAKQETSDTSVNDYMDNLCISIRRLGNALCEMVGTVAPGLERMTGMAESGDIVSVPLVMANGQRVQFSMKDIYVSVRAGKSYDTQREEFLERLLEIARIFPQMAVNAADIFVRYMDFQGNKEVEQRFFNALSPNVTGSEMVPVAQMQQAQAAMQQEIQKRDAEIQRLSLLVQKNTSDTVSNAQIRADAALRVEALRQAGQDGRQVKEILAKGEEKNREVAEKRRTEILEFIAKAGGTAA